MTMQIPCPHCNTPGKIRTSRRISESTKEAYLQCQNIDCCHCWKVIVSAVSTICPSLHPNPDVYIRHSQKARASPDGQGELSLNTS